uniref:Thiaminase II n=1 Tax=Fervidicoccus fontis TaxID=683846 RepID=A0A7J3ZJ55_9CREN
MRRATVSSGERLSERLRRDADAIWQRIFSHPFVVELYTGRLPLEKFKFYVMQDYNYLIGMMRSLSLLASKADYDVAKIALEIAHADATIEMENYVKLLERLGLRLEDVVAIEPAPTNEAYMNFLIATCALGSPLECLVSILPCFWSYAEIAERHKSELERNPNALYVEWASVYLSKEYIELVERLRDTVDRLWTGEGYERLKRIFLRSSKYEYMFWDMSYNMERWPT